MRRVLLPFAMLPLIAFTARAQLPLQLAECRLESASSRGAISAQCGLFEVAEDRATPNGKPIRIHVAVVRALRKQPLPDPVFLVSGGPGQAASDFYLSSYQAFETLRRDRDIVVIDQRGTGKSQRLDCNLPDELDTDRFDKELPLLFRFVERKLAHLFFLQKFKVRVEDPPRRRHLVFMGGSVLGNIVSDATPLRVHQC